MSLQLMLLLALAAVAVAAAAAAAAALSCCCHCLWCLALQVPRKPLLPFVLPPCALLEQRCCPAREVPLRAAVGVPR